MFGSFALVLIKGLLILSIGISNITGPPPPPLLLPEPPGGAPKQFNKPYENETKRIKTQFQLTERNRESIAPLGLDEANVAKLLKVFGTRKTKFAIFLLLTKFISFFLLRF